MSFRNFRKPPKFSIEDAFEEDLDDAICMYGATNERSPLKPIETNKGIEVKIQDSNSSSQINTSLHAAPSIAFQGRTENDSFLPIHSEDNSSKDSESLIPAEYYEPLETYSWWFQHPKIKENWRIVTGAFVLFFLGTILLITGVVIEAAPIDSLSGFVFLIAGFICFIPGVYHVVYIILAVQGRKGYDFYSLPLFN